MNLPRRKTDSAPRELRIIEQSHTDIPSPFGSATLDPFADRPDAWDWSAEPHPQPVAPQQVARPTWMHWWRPYAVAALPVGAALAYLVYLNAALFAIVTALTIIGVCSGAEKVRRCRHHD